MNKLIGFCLESLFIQQNKWNKLYLRSRGEKELKEVIK
jgi:hypothetical protein